MPYADHPLPKAEFDAIYARVPRLAVDLIVRQSGAVYLTKRAVEPCSGQWHLPGGTVRFGETVMDAVKRLARRELGIEVNRSELIGYLDYPSHFQHGLDSPVALVFEIAEYSGKPGKDTEASGAGWFRKFPHPMHADQDVFLVNRGYFDQLPAYSSK